MIDSSQSSVVRHRSSPGAGKQGASGVGGTEDWTPTTVDGRSERDFRYDVIIVGGGAMGCSVAYHLLRQEEHLRLAVVEKDSTYRQASSALSVGNARVQFSLRQNIEISLYAFEFLARFAAEMGVDEMRPDVGLRREGNLFLVEEAGSTAAEEALELQRTLGCEVEWLSPGETSKRFPLYRTSGFAGATFGPRDGHLDGYSLLMGFRNKAVSLGAEFIEAEVMQISTASMEVTGVELSTGARLVSPVVVNCAGAWAAGVAETTGVGLPVLPTQRQVFVVEPKVKPTTRLPLTNLPSGLYFRSEGDDRLLVGKSIERDRVGFDLRWEESRFTEVLWPELAEFVPAFDRLRVERGWAGLYAVNTLDGNAILGEWPELKGLYLANGFSGHGLQQAPAVGRYLAELITGQPPVLDLSVFGPDRILENRPLHERALV